MTQKPIQKGPIEIVSTSAVQWRGECNNGEVFALVDACGRRAVPRKCRQLGPERSVSLYRSNLETPETKEGHERSRIGEAERFAHTAPYLIKADVEVFDWLSEPKFGLQPWGVFIHCSADLPTLRRHLRKFLTVKGPDEKTYLFRFYDPRVLPGFLRASTPKELQQFMGPVHAFGVVRDGEIQMLRLRQS